MFIWKKNAKRLRRLESRLDHNSKIIQEDHDRLIELEEAHRRLIEGLDKCGKALQGMARKIEETNRRLNVLREAMSVALNKSEALNENG